MDENVVQIDELNLDKECIRLPSDYLKYASAAADAKRRVSSVENELSVIQADLASKIRANPQNYGLEKVTEAAIQASITCQSEYQEAYKKLIKVRHESDLAQAVVWALEHKKRSLTLLVELHGMGYFSAPKISKKGKEAVEEMTKKSVRRKFMDD